MCKTTEKIYICDLNKNITRGKIEEIMNELGNEEGMKNKIKTKDSAKEHEYKKQIPAWKFLC